ncbi:MAG: hypothetical protein ACLGSA_04990 [Acidobacteriota bacterium]
MSRLFGVLALFTTVVLFHAEAQARLDEQLGLDNSLLQYGLEFVGSLSQGGGAQAAGSAAAGASTGSGASALAGSLAGGISALFAPASSTVDLSLGAFGQGSWGSLVQPFLSTLPASSGSSSLSASLSQLFASASATPAPAFSASGLFGFSPSTPGPDGGGFQAGTLNALSLTLPAAAFQGGSFPDAPAGNEFTFSISGSDSGN